MALAGTRVRLLRDAAALAAAVCAMSSAPATAAEQGGLAFVGAGEEPVPVLMAKNRYGEYSGRLNVAVSNGSDTRGRLRLVFIPTTSGRSVNLSRDDEDEFVRRVRPPAARMRMAAHDVRYVRLALRVPGRASLSSVDGVLVAQLRPAKRGAAAVPEAELRIVGRPRQVHDVAFEPETMVMSTDCRLRPSGDCEGSEEVTLRGDGARRLAADGRDLDAMGILHDGAGDSALAELRGLSEDDNGVVTGEVEVSGASHAGKYSGVLAVHPGGEGAARIALEVSVGRSIWLAVLFVLVGAVLAYLMRRHEQVGMRRSDLNGRLSVAVNRYIRARNEPPGGPPASFDMERELGPPPWDRAVAGEDGIAGLRYQIAQADEPKEFDALGVDVDARVLRVCRWVELERGVQHARADAEQPVPRLGSHRIEGTRCRVHLDTLLDQAQGSEVLERCRSYLDELDARLRLYRRLRAVWVRTAELADRRDLSDDARARLREIKPWATIEHLPALGNHEPNALDRAHGKLRELEYRLTELDGGGQQRPRRAAGAHRAKRAPVWSRREAPAWETDLHQQWREERTDRAVSLQRNSVRAFANWHDAIWIGIAIAIGSAGYAVTLYDETWGSTVDYVTAVAAGFAAKFGTDAAQGFDWSSLPLVGRYFGPRGGGGGGEDGGEDAAETPQQAAGATGNGGPPEREGATV